MGTGCALWTEGGGRVSPRRARYFSLLRQRKVPKRKAPHSLRPCASLRATCGARSRGAPWNSLCADALRSDNPGELDNEACVSCGTHATPRPVLLGAARWKGGGIRAIAALGPQHAAERSDGPCGLQPPSGCTEHRRLPRRCAPGSRAAGSLSFAFFSWRDKKRRCPAGGTSRPPPLAQAPHPAAVHRLYCSDGSEGRCMCQVSEGCKKQAKYAYNAYWISASSYIFRSDLPEYPQVWKPSGSRWPVRSGPRGGRGTVRRASGKYW